MRKPPEAPSHAEFLRRASLGLAGGAATLGGVGGGLALFTGWTAHRVEQALPPRGRFLELQGHRIHYVDEGEGPAILMIHGLGGQMGNFTYGLVERLRSRFRVVVLDRPGSGYSLRAPGASAALGAQAAVIAAVVAALGLERPLVVGHSLGGAIALALALNHPGLVRGLALLSPLTQVQESVPGPFAGLYIPWPTLRWLASWTVATPATLLARDAAFTVLFGPERAPPDFATRGGGLLGLRPEAFYAASTDMMAVHQDLAGLVARYGEIACPTGILFGSEDRILDAAVHGARAARQIEGAVYEAIPGAGHMIPVTQPDRVAQFITEISERSAGPAQP